MAYIVKQKVNGKDYYYLRKSVRENGKVVSKSIAYLGKSKSEAVKKAEEILKGMDEKKDNQLVHKKISVEDLAVFCKRRGFVYPTAEIYGGFAGFWDYGFLGRELKENIKNEWWKFHVRGREDMTGIDGSIITHPKVWEASGHVESFTDFIVKNKKTKEIFKVDLHELDKYKDNPDFEVEGEFRPMFETSVGPYKKAEDVAYLRPETAQLIFTNFKQVLENQRMKLPFGIAQVGKSFRNEIAPREFLFRVRELEQMEIEYFSKPNEDCPYEIPDLEVMVYSAQAQKKNAEPVKMKVKDAFEKGIMKLKWHAYWLGQELLWFKKLGADLGNFRLRQHMKDELAHYSKDCWDLEYNFPFGWRELEGIADRGDYDLSRHEKFSKKDLKVFLEDTKEKILPHVVSEPSLGVERTFLVFMFEAMFQNKKGETILKLNPKLSPLKAAVFPIIKKEEYEKIAQGIVDDLKKEWNVIYDRSGSIGRRYARNDEAGTPYCITIDDKSPKNKDVTIRDRDTTKQIRVKIKDLKGVLWKLIEGEIEFEKAGKVVR